MKHRIAGKKLNRAVKPRQALFKSLIRSLVVHGKIETNLAKAKAIRPIIDKLVTKAKKKDLSSQRQIQAFLQDRIATNKLIKEIAPLFKNNSGFTKIARINVQRGNSIQMARVEWSIDNSKFNPSTRLRTSVQNSKLPETEEQPIPKKKIDNTKIKDNSKMKKSAKINEIKKK